MNKMTTEMIKSKLRDFIHNTVDLYMPCDTPIGKIQNATAKLYIDNNYYQIERIIDAFSDENCEIDVDNVTKTYEDVLFENGEMRLDIKAMLPDSMGWVKSFLPNKLILFKKGDLHNIFN